MTNISDPLMPGLTVSFSLLERAMIAYYAAEKNKSYSEVVRRMVHIFVDMDKGFNAERFKRFVKAQLVNDDFYEDHLGDLMAVTTEYAKRRLTSPNGVLTPSAITTNPKNAIGNS